MRLTVTSCQPMAGQVVKKDKDGVSNAQCFTPESGTRANQGRGHWINLPFNELGR